MIVCFRCTAETKEDLDRLLATGAYRDYDEAIAAAVRNQVLMEQEVAEKGAIFFGAPATPTVSPPSRRLMEANGYAAERGAPTKRPGNSPTAEKKNPELASATSNGNAPWGSHVPALFLRDGFPQEPPKGLADLPADVWGPGQVIPLDRWVLGQHNRLLPAKANARALIRLFIENPKGLVIGQIAERVAAEAAALGDYLSALDGARKTSRDDALATAFPTTSGDADKSRLRYANQFVVYQNGRGELSGLMVDLKLINIVNQRKERLIVPTRVAWELGRLQNPVLDGPDGITEKFSPEERSLLLRHIISSVPVEAFAYRVILEAVRSGNDSPEKIDAILKSYVTEERAEKLSQSFLASQRSGAVSRMSDLNLIERQREGVRVSYTVTEEGQAFLAQYAATEQ